MSYCKSVDQIELSLRPFALCVEGMEKHMITFFCIVIWLGVCSQDYLPCLGSLGCSPFGGKFYSHIQGVGMRKEVKPLRGSQRIFKDRCSSPQCLWIGCYFNHLFRVRLMSLCEYDSFRNYIKIGGCH